jgi:AcrR family transcriptional regulator
MTGDVPARPAKAPRPQPLRAERSAARRAAILKAALDEFCEKGFAATRVEDVAARAGVAKGTIYLNFKDKQALFEELIRSTLGAHIARLEAVRLEKRPAYARYNRGNLPADDRGRPRGTAGRAHAAHDR